MFGLASSKTFPNATLIPNGSSTSSTAPRGSPSTCFTPAALPPRLVLQSLPCSPLLKLAPARLPPPLRGALAAATHSWWRWTPLVHVPLLFCDTLGVLALLVSFGPAAAPCCQHASLWLPHRCSSLALAFAAAPWLCSTLISRPWRPGLAPAPAVPPAFWQSRFGSLAARPGPPSYCHVGVRLLICARLRTLSGVCGVVL